MENLSELVTQEDYLGLHVLLTKACPTSCGVGAAATINNPARTKNSVTSMLADVRGEVSE
jgi:hypothetical protein